MPSRLDYDEAFRQENVVERLLGGKSTFKRSGLLDLSDLGSVWGRQKSILTGPRGPSVISGFWCALTRSPPSPGLRPTSPQGARC
jgi:hypothetical protein